MDLLLVADGHYYKDSKGVVYVDTTYDYSFFKRYLRVFDKVYVVIRVENVSTVVPGTKKISSGDNVEFLEIPPFTGPWQYISKYLMLNKLVRKYCSKGACGIFRLPGAVPNLVCKQFVKTRKPFAVEVVIDPWENFRPGLSKSILRPFIRLIWTYSLRKNCLKAAGVSYVTKYYLQKKYPCRALLNKKGFTSSYSSVELPDDLFSSPRKYCKKDTWYISHITNTFSGYSKGHLPLMDAISLCHKWGYDIRVVFIGDGPKKQEFIDYAKQKNISEYVTFTGRFPDVKQVRERVSKTDLFVFPTMAEGLPRGLLEAMAEGMPCISSPTCGIPEVLDKNYLVDYYDSKALAKKIINMISNPKELEKCSLENINTAKRFSSTLLNHEREQFYERLKQIAT